MFKQGHTKKGGRQKGSENKDKKELREKFNLLLESYGIDAMIKDLKELGAKDRLITLASMAEFLIPKLQRTEIKADVEVKTTEVFKIAGQEIEFASNN